MKQFYQLIFLLVVFCLFFSGCALKYSKKISTDEINEQIISNKPIDLTQSYKKHQIILSFQVIPVFKNSDQIKKRKMPIDYYNRYPVPVSMITKGNMIYYLTNQQAINDGYNLENPDQKLFNPVVAFDTKTKLNQWIYKIEYPLFQSLAISDRIVFIGTDITDKAIGQDKNFITALDIMTGKEKWTFRLKDHIPSEISQTKEKVASLSLKGGIQYWNHQVFCIVETVQYILGQDSASNYETNNTYYLHSLNDNNGSLNWYYIFPTGEVFINCSTFQIDQDRLLIANGDPHGASDFFVYSVDLPNRKVKKLSTIMMQDLIIKSSTAYFLSNNTSYLAGSIDLDTGKIPWSFGLNTLPKDTFLSFDRIYSWQNWLVLGSDFELTGIDSNNQDIQWTVSFKDLEPYLFHSYAQDGSILYYGVGPQDYNQGKTYIVAFDITTHQFLWKWKIPYNPNPEPGYTNGSLYISLAPNLINGSLYFISNQGDIYEMPVKNSP